MDYRNDRTAQYDILTSNDLERIKDWLCWHDPNGCYTDEDCASEDQAPLTLDEARAIMMDQLAESLHYKVSVQPSKVDNAAVVHTCCGGYDFTERFATYTDALSAALQYSQQLEG